MMIGSANISFFILSAVSCSREYFPKRFKNCLGFSDLDSGQSLVPAPPANITGVIEI